MSEQGGAGSDPGGSQDRGDDREPGDGRGAPGASAPKEGESTEDGGGAADSGPARTDVLDGQGPKGSVQERMGTERDALSGFARAEIIADTVIGRDQYHVNLFSGPDARRVRVAQLRRPDVEEIEAFVDPEDFADLCQQARGRRVVILQAEPGCGRYAAARRLLRVLYGHGPIGGQTGAQTGGQTRGETGTVGQSRGAAGAAGGAGLPLFGVNPAVPLEELTRADLTPGGGYICRDLERPGTLTGFLLDRLTTVLEDVDAHLVITVDAAHPLTDPAATELVLRVGRVRDRREIVRRQLELRLGAGKAELILAESDVARLIDERLGSDGPPRDARAVAVELVRAYQQALPLARTAEQALRLSYDERWAGWFEGLDTLSLQCMAVATAVLSGEPYETVALAAMQLRELLETESPHDDSKRRLDAPLRPTKREWLAKLDARTVPSTVRVRHGATAPTEVIRYLDPYAQGRVLGYFWSEFDEQRPHLLDWLRWCAGHPLESVRTRTAVATGFLTARGFDLVRALVIEPWARDKDPRFRTVAAAALCAAVRQRQALRGTVRELLRGWGGAHEPPELRATAARAWQVEYEARGAEAALGLLEEYTSDEDVMVTAAVCESITELWATEGEGGAVPARLLSWVGEGKEARRLTARLAFLVAAMQLVRRLPGDDFDWPGLLHVASVDADRTRDIAALWREVVNEPTVQGSAQEALFEWARMADRVPLVRRSLARLALVISTDPVTIGRVRFAARRWAEGDRSAPASSSEVLTALNGR